MQKGARRQSSGHAPAHELDDALIVREVDLERCRYETLLKQVRDFVAAHVDVPWFPVSGSRFRSHRFQASLVFANPAGF